MSILRLFALVRVVVLLCGDPAAAGLLGLAILALFAGLAVAMNPPRTGAAVHIIEI